MIGPTTGLAAGCCGLISNTASNNCLISQTICMTFDELVVGNWYFCRTETYTQIACKVARMRLLAKHPPDQAIFVYRKRDADPELTGSAGNVRVLTTIPLSSIVAPESANTPPLEYWDTAVISPTGELLAVTPTVTNPPPTGFRKLVVDLQSNDKKRSCWQKLFFHR